MKIIKTPAEIDTRLKSFVVVADSETAMKNSIDIVREYGYEIIILDFWHKDISCHYYPFKYVHSDQDVYEMADCIFKDIKGIGGMAERQMFICMILYLRRIHSPEKLTFADVINLPYKEIKINGFQCFDTLNGNGDEAFTKAYYRLKDLCPANRIQGTAISLSVKICLAVPFLDNIFADDTLGLNDKSIKYEKTAIFLPDYDDDITFRDFYRLAAMQLEKISQEE